MADSGRFERNLGFLSEQEQDQIKNSTIAIAGAGGDGGMLALQLARLGVESFRLADPDPFEIENTNRQAVCSEKTIGTNKAEAVADYILNINPEARVITYTQGINQENTAEFVEGSNLVIDETEFTLPELGVMLAREARKRDIAVLTALNIGFGAIVTTFHPRGKTLEKILGFREDDDIESIATKRVSLDRWLPYLPKYGDVKVLNKVATGEKSAPSIAPGVAIAAGIGATQAFLNIVGDGNNRPKPIYAPNAYVVDVMSMEAKRVKFSRRSHYRHLGSVITRNILQTNPQTSY